jgi:hypothetical protein
MARSAGKLPDELLDAWRQFRGAGDAHQWEIGDLIDAAVVEYAGRVTQARIYREASKTIEVSVGQVRKCRETAMATPASLRDEFDVLTFEHFAKLRFDEPAEQRKWLAWCLDTAPSYGGRPAPAVVMERAIKTARGEKPPAPTFADCARRAIAALERGKEVYEHENEYKAAVAALKLLDRWA